MRTMLTVGAVVVGLLAAGVSPAFAAKGVKKSENHPVHGVVVSVNHGDAKAGSANAGGHEGEITVKVHSHKKKGKGAAKAGKKSSTKTEQFTVGKETKFEVVNGKQHRAGTFADVKPGEHVVISHNGRKAEKVIIHSHSTKKKPKKK
ncbi:MAG TPA: hypothetical protein VKS79_16565 [Gemmataceae bacterium]|nr:hypothetical protein [Gemmataceae bacterium]